MASFPAETTLSRVFPQNGSRLGRDEGSPYEAVFQLSGHGMAILERRTDGTFRIKDYNRAAERAIGSGSAGSRAAAGCSLEEVLPGISAMGLNGRLNESLDTNSKVHLGAIEYRPPSGPQTVFTGDVVPLEDNLLLISFENITGHVEQLPGEGTGGDGAQLDSLAVRVAQELREPVGSIKLAADLLFKDESQKLPHPAGEYIAHIRASVGSMKERIDDVTTLARVRGQEMVFRDVNLTGLVRAVVAERRLEIDALEATVEVGRLATVPGDPTLLRQLFSNLMANALKFRRDSVKPVIRIASEPMPSQPGLEDNKVRVSVADNGVGFSRDMARHIFHMFETTQARPSGSTPGLSLGLCRLIVERHNGLIWATGTPGVGARFTIELPKA
ncbi:MAG: HAMP domain-containing histidine kinase [Rhodothermales bacterium]|nr:HAMP domain-containing histidine kinase [Rhodothermales bacterium]MBO6778726.1 HAMP domain-containing histidine kinase [Rhodothermales bacterium]